LKYGGFTTSEVSDKENTSITYLKSSESGGTKR